MDNARRKYVLLFKVHASHTDPKSYDVYPRTNVKYPRVLKFEVYEKFETPPEYKGGAIKLEPDYAEKKICPFCGQINCSRFSSHMQTAFHKPAEITQIPRKYKDSLEVRT